MKLFLAVNYVILAFKWCKNFFLKNILSEFRWAERLLIPLITQGGDTIGMDPIYNSILDYSGIEINLDSFDEMGK